MKRALIKSLAGHFGLALLIGVFWYWESFIAGSKPRGYPSTINAVLIEKAVNRKGNYQSRQTAPPKNRIDKPQAPQKVLPKPNPRQTEPVVEPQSPEHSMEQETGSQPSVTSLSLDVLEFPFPQYLALLQYRVERQWRPSFSGTAQLSSTVFFRIDRNGKLLETLLEKSSGDFAFDQAALRAVYNAEPLPQLPVEAALSSLGVHFEFVGGP